MREGFKLRVLCSLFKSHLLAFNKMLQCFDYPIFLRCLSSFAPFIGVRGGGGVNSSSTPLEAILFYTILLLLYYYTPLEENSTHTYGPIAELWQYKIFANCADTVSLHSLESQRYLLKNMLIGFYHNSFRCGRF